MVEIFSTLGNILIDIFYAVLGLTFGSLAYMFGFLRSLITNLLEAIIVGVLIYMIARKIKSSKLKNYFYLSFFFVYEIVRIVYIKDRNVKSILDILESVGGIFILWAIYTYISGKRWVVITNWFKKMFSKWKWGK